MNILKKSALASAVACTMALASQVAHADLIIMANGSQVGPTDTTNNSTSYTGTIGGFNVNVLSATGAAAFGPSGDLLDVGSLDVSTAGTGTLKLMFIETNLSSAPGSAAFQIDYSGLIKGATVTRSWFVDAGNGGTEATMLGSASGQGGSFVASPVSLSGSFSLTEEIDITATAQGAKLSSDDTISVPEPAMLSLMGLGLSALAFARRRKSI